MQMRNIERVWITTMMIVTIPHFLNTLNIALRYSVFFVAVFVVQEIYMWFVLRESGQIRARWKVLVFIIIYYTAATAYSVSPRYPWGLFLLASAGALASALSNMPHKEDEQPL